MSIMQALKAAFKRENLDLMMVGVMMAIAIIATEWVILKRYNTYVTSQTISSMEGRTREIYSDRYDARVAGTDR